MVTSASELSRHTSPPATGGTIEISACDGGQPVIRDVRRGRIENDSVHRQESLRVGGGFEPAHLSLALSGRLMRAFCSIVLVPLRTMNDRRHHEAMRRRVAAKLVGNQTPRRPALPFQQLAEKACGGTPIAPGLDEDVDHIAVLVNGTPQILPPALDVHEQFVQVPGVAQASSPAPERTGVRRTECPTPLPKALSS